MSRIISPLLQRALNAQETGEVILAIVSIDHPSIVGGPLRVVNDMQNLVSNGNTYTAFPFQITLPEDSDTGLPKLKLILDNVDRSIIIAVRGIPPSSPPTVQVDFVLASQPDVIEASFSGLKLRQVSYDAMTVEGELTVSEDDLEPFPWRGFTPNDWPGLF